MQTFVADQSEVAQAKSRLSEIAVLHVLVCLHHVWIADADAEVYWVGDGVVERLRTVTWSGCAIHRLTDFHLL